MQFTKRCFFLHQLVGLPKVYNPVKFYLTSICG